MYMTVCNMYNISYYYIHFNINAYQRLSIVDDGQ